MFAYAYACLLQCQISEQSVDMFCQFTADMLTCIMPNCDSNQLVLVVLACLADLNPQVAFTHRAACMSCSAYDADS